MSAQVLGLSVDSTDCLRAWADSLGGISYPLLSDFFPHGAVSREYGVLREEGYSERCLYVIDKAGIIRYAYVSDLDTQPDNLELFRVLRSLEPAASASATRPQPAEYIRPDAQIVMFCTPWCSDCRKARAWLMGRGLPYREVDISRDRAAAAQVRRWAGGNETTPTFDVNGTIIVDWDEARVKAALGIS
jgi:glutaredoxin